MITKNLFERSINGFQIQDVAVRSRTAFYFLARHKEESIKASPLGDETVTKRLLGFAPDKGNDRNIGHWQFQGYGRLVIGASQIPNEKGICVSSGGDVLVSGGGHHEVEEDIPKKKEGPRRGAIRRIRMIQGRLYVVGAGHTVCWRRGANDWESLCLNLPLGTQAEHDDEKKSEDMAFEDIDGFAHNDLYVIAGRGVVWHCNGKAWRRIPFPSNMLVKSICCAGDGNVYIGAQSGTLFRGRENHWEMVHRGDLTLPFKDIVWHTDQLWCTNDYGLWTVDDGKVKRIEDMPSDIAICTGNLSAADGVVLMGGVHGAAFHDGQKWQLIFNQYQMEQAVENSSS
jgi:hypothetical protein